MKKILITLAAMAMVGVASAQVNVSREALGSGTPGTTGAESATRWDGNVYHVPQYMPGYPTAATIFPRVVDVDCSASATTVNCKGFNWSPDMGRAEYLMVRPRIVKPAVPVAQAPIVILKEVPAKPKGQ